jgi:hypothetical protein
VAGKSLFIVPPLAYPGAVGFDGITDYYDVGLKRARHALLAAEPGFSATEALLEDDGAFDAAASAFAPDVIVHLAAQAGVRYSIDNPRAYLDANITGSFHVMEAARRHNVRHLMMASTSSVYGANTEMPYAEGPQGRHADVLLRRDQEGDRGDEPCLGAYPRPAGDDVPVLHRLWPLGAARHGAVQVHQGDSGGRAHRRLQPRRHVAGFHLCG